MEGRSGTHEVVRRKPTRFRVPVAVRDARFSDEVLSLLEGIMSCKRYDCDIREFHEIPPIDFHKGISRKRGCPVYSYSVSYVLIVYGMDFLSGHSRERQSIEDKKKHTVLWKNEYTIGVTWMLDRSRYLV